MGGTRGQHKEKALACIQEEGGGGGGGHEERVIMGGSLELANKCIWVGKFNSYCT